MEIIVGGACIFILKFSIFVFRYLHFNNAKFTGDNYMCKSSANLWISLIYFKGKIYLGSF